MHLTLYLAHEKYPLLDLCAPTPVPPTRPPKPRWARPRNQNKNDSDSRRSTASSGNDSDSPPSPPPRKPQNERVHWTLAGPTTVTLQVHTQSGNKITLTVHL
ncbi:probable protein E4 [Human papillomavirus type 78]|uniref:Probable protein E4 n=1 Tax=Human papillomavirus type 78 TaxID=1297549 RepID=A0A024FB73_9PAPI|nr:probable protein E4 [Human papillomavirus type 78]